MPKLMYFLIFYSFLVFCSCSKTNNYGSDITKINIDSVICEKPILFTQLFSEFKIIPLELNSESLVGTIQNIKLVNDTFYVFDTYKIKTLFLFSKEGKYLNKICKIGKGPGEYLNPINFEINTQKKRIIIYDWASQKLNYYDLNCNFQNCLNIHNYFTSFTCNDDQIYFHISNPKNENSYLFNVFNTQGKIISQHFKFKDYSYGLKYNALSRFGNFFKGKEDIKLFMPLCDTIFSIKNNKVKPLIVLDSKKFKLTDEDILNLKKDKSKPFPLLMTNLNKLYNIREFCEWNNNIFLKFDIGYKLYWLIYNSESGKIFCSSKRQDDLTFLNPEVFMINNHQFASIINQKMLPKLQENILTDKIKLSETDKEIILKKTGNDNPLIVIYNVK